MTLNLNKFVSWQILTRVCKPLQLLSIPPTIVTASPRASSPFYAVLCNISCFMLIRIWVIAELLRQLNVGEKILDNKIKLKDWRISDNQ